MRSVTAVTPTTLREAAAAEVTPLADLDPTDALAAFAKVVAHDFSGPLQSVRGFGILLLGHLHECKAPCLTGVPIGHNVDAFHRAVSRKSRVQVFLRRLVAEIPYEDVCHETGPYS